jgi:hypothetical protein
LPAFANQRGEELRLLKSPRLEAEPPSRDGESGSSAFSSPAPESSSSTGEAREDA